MNEINSFHGDNSFLSNFFMHNIMFDGILYPSSEHAYQAAKTLDMHDKMIIAKTESPGYAKSLGQLVEYKADWAHTKIDVMYNILEVKFSDLLKSTYPKDLIEGNNWNDTFWGVCDGKGRNELGKCLMRLRDKLLGLGLTSSY